MAAISDPWNDVGHKVGVDPIDDAGIDISDLKQGAHLQLGATPSTSADDPAADAQAQRNRSLEHDAENRVGQAEGIAGVNGADSTACKGIRTNSPAGDSL